jgi:hypothetical protein
MTEWRPLWDVNREKHFAARSAVGNCTLTKNHVVAESCCDLVGSLVDSTCDSRHCLADNTFCPPRIFEDSKIWGTCPTRSEKRKNPKERV